MTGREHLLKTGLVLRNEDGRVYDRFRERIMFPIRDSRGRVVGFGGRVLDQGEPKYLNSPETPVFHKGRELYGLYEARRANRQLDTVDRGRGLYGCRCACLPRHQQQRRNTRHGDNA